MQHLCRTFGTGIEKKYKKYKNITFFRSPANAAVGHVQVRLP
jgi:hypothetical protein